MNKEPRKHIGNMSADARSLIDRLSKLEVDQVVTYEELSKVVGKPVNGSSTALQRAKRRLLMDEGMVLETVAKHGVKRLNDVDTVMTSEQTRNRIRGTARRGLQKISAVRDFNSLPNDMKVTWNAAAAWMGLVKHAMDGRQIKKIELKVHDATTQLSLTLAETLEAFKKSP